MQTLEVRGGIVPEERVAHRQPDRPEELEALCSAYLAAQLRADLQEAIALLERGLAQEFTVQELRRHVLAEAQRQVGNLWQTNAISYPQEHRATAISHVALARLYDSAPLVPRNGKRVVFACVEGEFHDFPARLAADAFDLAGFDVRHLGANVPRTALLDAVDREKADLLCLSATATMNLGALRRTLPAVRETWPRLRIAVGGEACCGREEELRELGADLVAGAAEDEISKVGRVLGLGEDT